MARKTAFEGLKPVRERCRNPWNGRCENTDIQLYIVYRGERFPICAKCWSEICESDLEWGEDKTESVKRVGKVMRSLRAPLEVSVNAP